ncbi:MAG: VanW family protein, partial [Clostridia bacterium]|nr:VanW family protein [Clostridia bacterium]
TTAANAINRAPTAAHIASFDMTNYAFTFAEGEPGKQLDTATLESDIITTLKNGGGTVEPVITEIAPSNTVSEISSQYGMISAAVTNASSSSSNRISNIRLAMATINGTCLEPGESFSFNGVVGRRTTERGYKKAGAYANGEVTEEVGGGICQVSTTLFNAVDKADLQIDERHNHSLPVSYVDNGKDATVDYGNQDFRFTNNSDDKIYICCVVTDDKRVRVGIFGKLLPNGETITVESRTTGSVPYTTEYRANMTYASGYSQVTRPGKNGATAEAYKVRHDASGNIISTELLCKSTYKATSEIIEYGP